MTASLRRHIGRLPDLVLADVPRLRVSPLLARRATVARRELRASSQASIAPDTRKGLEQAIDAPPAAPAAGYSYGISAADGYPQNAKFAYCVVATVPCPTSGNSSCPGGDCLQGYYLYGFNAFTELRQGAPLGYARFFVDYDALLSWNGSACGYSPAATLGAQPGLAAFDQLLYDVQAAQADGLTPVVVFTNGIGNFTVNGQWYTNPVPQIPEPGYGSSSHNAFTNWTTAGYDYLCGVDGMMDGIAANLGGDPVTHWEAWNEPNGLIQPNSDGGGYNGALGPCTTGGCIGAASSPGNPTGGYPNGPCGSQTYALYDGQTVTNDCGGQVNPSGTSYPCYASSYTNCGPVEASILWEGAQYIYETDYPTMGFKVAALTLSNAENSVYLLAYLNAISSVTLSGLPYDPTVWAVHDYNDPSSIISGAHGDISSFTSNLDTHWGGGQEVWITEAAIDLNDSAESDANRAATKTLSKWAGCTNTESDHKDTVTGDYMFGACSDANAYGQAVGANAFMNIGSYGNGETITQVDWYEYLPENRSPAWDSGLFAPPSEVGGYTPPAGGVYGSNTAATGERESFCVLAHASSGCSNVSADASDWSTNPSGL
jgi:hypothetical protein